MKKSIKRIKKAILIAILSPLTSLAKKFSKMVYKWLMYAEWKIVDNPENFDHYIDLYYQWVEFCRPHWLERGLYSVQAMKMFEEPIVVELCCGDGFNAKHFYSTSSRHIYACDYDAAIIKLAEKQKGKYYI